jgi:hypothetical protein
LDCSRYERPASFDEARFAETLNVRPKACKQAVKGVSRFAVNAPVLRDELRDIWQNNGSGGLIFRSLLWKLVTMLGQSI